MVKPSPALMWGTATLMVTIVSCCSLIGVSIMPLISGPSYKSFITLFTGLAVGSLLGSAIFSLIPQAFSLHLAADKAYLWKSLIIFFGIYLFYCSERLMRIYFDRKVRNKSQKESTQLRQKNKSSASNSNSDEQNDNNHTTTTRAGRSGGDQMETTRANIKAIEHNENSTTSDVNAAMTEISLSKDDQEDQTTHGHNHHHHHHSSLKPHEIITKALRVSGNLPVPRRSEIAPLAWMIIIGDGLHNFIDGLSIGAAFTESIYQGMIICIAVIFEELPHELGDFAVLISSGMSVRQALGFNFLSACTCYIGMIFGIVLGDTTQSASFIFALAAGMFFYISLVDMMGELNAALEECKDSTKESTHLLLMQNIGILSGITIIFSLSMFGPGG